MNSKFILRQTMQELFFWGNKLKKLIYFHFFRLTNISAINIDFPAKRSGLICKFEHFL